MTKQLLSIQLLGDAERVRQSHSAAIAELQAQPSAGERITTVTLKDGVPTNVSHGLGRPPAMVTVSPLRGPVTAGFIEEIRAGVDRTKIIVLKATGYGAPVDAEISCR